MNIFRILDPFTLTLITVVLLASFFPAEGDFVPVVEGITTAAIALLFFMHGAKLSREAIIAGGSHWRLHLWVMCSTFILFPVLGVLFAWWAPVNVDPMLYTGGLLSLSLQPAGDFPLPAVGWSGDEYSWRRRQSGAGRENHAATAVAVCARTPFPPVDRQVGRTK